MTVYIDSFFLLNFILDFLAIFISARLMGKRISVMRFLLSAGLGGIASCIALFIPLLWGIFAKVSVVILMEITAFGFSHLKAFLMQTAILFFGFFVMGGAVGILSYSESFPVLSVMSATFFALIITFFISEKIKTEKGKCYAEVEIYKDGKTFNLTALIDSGNLCTDFLTGLPVIVAEDVFFGIERREFLFSTASGLGEMGIFYPDFAEVKIKNEIFKGKDVAVGIIEGSLSPDKRFNALIGGICFDRLYKENNGVSFSFKKREWSLLHRNGTAASATPFCRRGGKTFRGTCER